MSVFTEEEKVSLLKSCKGMIGQLTRKYARALWGYDVEDVHHIALEGFVKALNGYNPSKEAKFSTYAHYLIERELHNEVVKTHAEKRVPVNKSVSFDDHPIVNAMCHNNVMTLRPMNPDGSYTNAYVEKHINLSDILPDLKYNHEEEIIMMDSLVSCISRLTDEREVYIINGILMGKTYEEMGEVLGLSHSWVRLTWKNTQEKFRKWMGLN
jgi:RNA polymerase sigma factor (sigma-70 family)